MIDEEFTVSEQTLLCAFDYSIGRKTYVVGLVVRDLQDNAETMSQKARQYMIKELNRRWQINALGHDQDREQWVRLLHQLNEIESESQLL